MYYNDLLVQKADWVDLHSLEKTLKILTKRGTSLSIELDDAQRTAFMKDWDPEYQEPEVVKTVVEKQTTELQENFKSPKDSKYPLIKRFWKMLYNTFKG